MGRSRGRRDGGKQDIEREWEEGMNLQEEEEKGGTEKVEEEKVMPGKSDRGEGENEDKKAEDKGMRKEIKRRRKENSPSSWHLPDTHKLYPSKSLNNIVST